jgi:hypothetical protein
MLSAMQVPITLPHFFDFGDARVGRSLLSPTAWDTVRANCEAFAIPQDVADAQRRADAHQELAARASVLNRLFDGLGARTVASYGVGPGLLELHLLRQAQHRRIVAGDNAPGSIAKLATAMPELHPRLFDLLADQPMAADVHLLHRVDTDLSDQQWREVFARFRSETIILVASEILHGRRAFDLIRASRREDQRSKTHAGWLRNRASFERLWRRTHRQERVLVADLAGWVLTPMPA